MPRGDRTGPDGWGPMTGRRAGYCAGYDVPGYANDSVPPMGRGRGWGRGAGRGFGRGFGWGRGRGYYPPPADPGYPGPAPAREVPVYRQEDEVAYLEGAARQLEEELKAIKDRLAQLAGATEKKEEE